MKDSRNSMSTIPVTLSFLFLFIYSFEDILAAPIHLCRPEQRDALLEFKNEFEIDESLYGCSYPKTESWSNNSNCCNWEGITCNAKSGEVMELDLSKSCLQGHFHSNSSLQNLQFLTTLDLSSNGFGGQIPSSIGNLSKLTSIDLSDNNFSGQIPSLIGNLSHLTFLSFAGNRFVDPIPSWIANCSHLTDLLLDVNSFSGQIPSWIGNLSQLTRLTLSHNQFVGRVPSWIGNLSHLTSLFLDGNSFSGQIPSSIGNLSQLTFLTLNENQFVGHIPASFGNLNKLTFLYFQYNKLSGEIPIELSNLTALSKFYLSDNQFTGSLLPNFTSLSNLHTFFAYNNALSGTLPSSLFSHPSLTYIHLRNNQLSGFPEFGNISSPSNLVLLDLSNNNFLGPIPKSISKLTNLQGLCLSHFNTQGPVDFSIFSPLKSLRELELSHWNTTTTIPLNDILSSFKELYALDLSCSLVSVTNKTSVSDPHYFNLSGCGITEFPEFLRTQKSMDTLDISNNNIKGQVPSWLWTLPSLEYVNLSNSTFSDFEVSTKNALSSVSKSSIEYLFGTNNKFTGQIPSFICALRSLRTLDLSNNYFNGSIPRCMGNLKGTLSVLNLRQNRLQEGLPENIFNSLRSLDVGHNQLVGKLPRSLIHFSALEVLNVESNGINDTFPFWLGSLQNLQVLVLRSNAFHGPIHQASFPKLQIVDISHNHFNGTLPSDYFEKWSAMSSLGTNEEPWETYMGDSNYHDSMVMMNKGIELELKRILKIYTGLDFSGNKLEGEIPKSIGLLKELHVLNLSDNAFTGHIPSSMGNLIALESLDVSRNQLSGEIPQELGRLTFLEYMNFSHNQLSGLVPGGTQFRRQPCSSFEDNLRLFGPSLEEDCNDIHAPAPEDSKMPGQEEEEEDEELLSWTAAAIGYVPGIIFGFTIGYILDSYKPEWFLKPFGRNKRRSGNTTTQ